MKPENHPEALKQKRPQKNLNNKSDHNKKVGQVKIDFYTDPLCCWSWAFDQHWRKLLLAYQDQIEYRYIMGGMIPDWKSYNDPLNSVSRPIQMGPIWMHASEVTHVKMKYSIWHEDPPTSSYPACIAVKTAGLQSKHIEDKYLYKVRHELMTNGTNISKPEVLMTLAEKLDDEHFNIAQFKKDWQAGRGREAFKLDLQQAKFHNIGRFPTLTFRNESGKGIMIVGYRPYDVLEKAFKQISSLQRV